MKFRANTDECDYRFKRSFAIRLLRAGNHVKAVVLVRGRGIEQVDLGAKLLVTLEKKALVQHAPGCRPAGAPMCCPS
jgi:translation initiation factor IF-3